MMRFEDYLAGQAERYLATIREKRCAGKELAIYGAGKIGKSLCSYLQKNGIAVGAFCVTKKASNTEEIFGVPVYSLREIAQQDKDYCFLVGVGKSLHHTIEEILVQQYHADFLPLPDGITTRWDRRFNRPLIQVTPKVGCSINCRYCPQDLFLKKYYAQPRRAMMSLSDYKKCLDKTPPDTVIEFAGFVEPFLNPEAAEMMRYTASTGREVNLFTTLVGMDWETWMMIKDIPFTMVVLHLPDVKGYANIPMSDEYLKLLDAMTHARKKDGSPFVERANSQSTIHPDVMKVVKDRIFIDTTQLIDRAGNLEMEELQSGGVPHGALLCPTSAKLDHNILLPDGSLVLCCMDFGMQHVLGNLLKESYEEIMQGKPLKEIVDKMWADGSEGLLCRTCVRALAVSK